MAHLLRFEQVLLVILQVSLLADIETYSYLSALLLHLSPCLIELLELNKYPQKVCSSFLALCASHYTSTVVKPLATQLICLGLERSAQSYHAIATQCCC